MHLKTLLLLEKICNQKYVTTDLLPFAVCVNY